MASLPGILLGAIAAFVMLLLVRKEGKKAGVRQAQAEAAESMSEHKVEVANETAQAKHDLPTGAQYNAVVDEFLRRRAARLDRKDKR